MGVHAKLMIAVMALWVAGCATQGGAVRQPNEVKTQGVVASPSQLLSQLTSTMARQLAENQGLQKPTNGRVAVASFVDIDDLGRTSPLGLQLAENLMHEMHVRGFSVIDFKMRDALKVSRNGDFVFSRDLADLKREQSIRYYLSGTISQGADGVLINARLIDVESSLVTSSARAYFAKGLVHTLNSGEYGSGLQLSKVMLK